MTPQPLEITEPAQAQQMITTFTNYGLTWFVYTLLIFLLVGIIWYVIRNWHFIAKWFISSVILAGALTAGRPADNTETYSPLVLNSVVKLFDDDKAGFMSGLKTIGLVWALLFILGIVAWFAYNRFITNKDGKPPQKIDTEKRMATPIDPKT